MTTTTAALMMMMCNNSAHPESFARSGVFSARSSPSLPPSPPRFVADFARVSSDTHVVRHEGFVIHAQIERERGRERQEVLLLGSSCMMK